MGQKHKSRGFSLVELLVVTAVVLVIAAIAAPMVTRNLRAYRVGAAATDVANFIQRTRYEAIRRNITTTSRAQVTNGRWQVWIDYNQNQRVDANEPFILMPNDMVFLNQSQVPSAQSMGYTSTSLIQGRVSFDSRGTVDYGPGVAPSVLLCYIGNPTDPNSGYRAVAVTPAGKTQIWRSAGPGDTYWHK